MFSHQPASSWGGRGISGLGLHFLALFSNWLKKHGGKITFTEARKHDLQAFTIRTQHSWKQRKQNSKCRRLCISYLLLVLIPKWKQQNLSRMLQVSIYIYISLAQSQINNLFLFWDIIDVPNLTAENEL